MPHLWQDTHEIVLGGAALPAITQWVQDTLPKGMAGMIGLAPNSSGGNGEPNREHLVMPGMDFYCVIQT